VTAPNTVRSATEQIVRRFTTNALQQGAEVGLIVCCAAAVRSHWGIENSLHWVLDVVFGEDRSRLRTGHGANNMAVIRHFAINAVRIATGKRSIKTTRKIAGWDPDVLAKILQPHCRQPGLGALRRRPCTRMPRGYGAW